LAVGKIGKMSDNSNAAQHVLQAAPPLQNAVNAEKDDWVENISTIWDDDKISWFITPDGIHKWKCLWCGGELPYWNSTKALAHLALTDHSKDIQKCDKAHTYPLRYQKCYKNLKEQRDSMNKRKHNATQAVINLAEEHGNETAAVLDQQRKKTKIPMATGNIHSFFDKVVPKSMSSTEKIM